MAILFCLALISLAAAAKLPPPVDHLPDEFLKLLGKADNGISSRLAYELLQHKINENGTSGSAKFKAGVSPNVIGGSPAAAGRWPWQASLQLYVPFLGGWYHICGAVLIRGDVALTAAHCIDVLINYYDYRINIGTNDISAGDGQNIDIAQGIMHPNYMNGEGTFPNDIAVLKLAKPAILSSTVQVVQMATSKDNFNHANQCWISGWGVTEEGSGSSDLREAQMNIYDTNSCTCNWQIAGETPLNAGHICIKNPGRSSCNGDSGGPFVCKSRSNGHTHGKGHASYENTHGNGHYTWKLLGVTSWGARGCPTYMPSVYTRVSYFYDWVVQTMNS